ncbi:MAG: hypothetical protein AB1758_28720 [Candidatus Eremiobacterota bacterium]
MGRTVLNMQAAIQSLQDQVQALHGGLGEARGGIRALGAEIQEGTRQFVGRMRLQEQRFTAMMDVVDRSLRPVPTREEFEELRARVEALEGRPPAA